MKILRVEATNFGSYEHFEMDIDNVGLALIYGKTGSGKSTIMDMICWGLYGITSKNGTVDSVLPWYASRDTSVIVYTEGGTVTRIRNGSARHDLYFSLPHSTGASPEAPPTRGKDSRDTQLLLNDVLGVSPELFLSSCYIHEFSDSANFFVAKAKYRREVFEKIAPLQFPNKLAERIARAKKETKKQLTTISQNYDKDIGGLNQLKRSYAEGIEQAALWAEQQEINIRNFRDKKDTFDDDKENRMSGLQRSVSEIQERISKYCRPGYNRRIGELQTEIKDLTDEVCKECGQNTSSRHLVVLSAELHRLQRAEQTLAHDQSALKSLTGQLEEIKVSENPFGDALNSETARANPFTQYADKIALQLTEAELVASLLFLDLEELRIRLVALDQLSEFTRQLRGNLLMGAVKECEETVNKMLSKTFDSEFSVAFSVSGDNLETQITKNGYSASYSQLSKGQRRLLSLCFSLTIMEMSANSAGVHMNLLMLDEPCDGMDDEMKVKAYALYEELSLRHPSVLVIEHSHNTQSLFDKKYKVEMESDRSCVLHE